VIEGLAARDLVKEFDGVYALRGASLAAAAGEVVALLGPNGAGKSTLLSLLAGLLEPTSGSVVYRVGGESLGPLRVRERLGFLGHQSFLHPDLSAMENLVFYARLYGMPAPRAAAAAALGAAGLAANMDRPLRTFSRGMGQRAALARALLADPEVVLLDEPFAGLDEEGAAYVAAVIRERRGRGRLVLLSTHEAHLARDVADRIAFLRDGRVEREIARPFAGEPPAPAPSTPA